MTWANIIVGGTADERARYAARTAEQPIDVDPGTVTITRPAYLVGQFREACATIDRLYAPRPSGRDLTDAEEAQADAAEETRSDARAALRAMVTSWGVDPDHLAEALA